ncbi:hypothetical protein DFH07DRAFT_944092 [Mycena maculata]|uniref:Uncharacterized protein n=1 Tax=Mycena maculata TaxID=230809 RepID=A0AAD7I9V5_9AGAR|nr:hypothetical protein DFH07DRAFT_944092 [Mycena maculata]
MPLNLGTFIGWYYASYVRYCRVSRLSSLDVLVVGTVMKPPLPHPPQVAHHPSFAVWRLPAPMWLSEDVDLRRPTHGLKQERTPTRPFCPAPTSNISMSVATGPLLLVTMISALAPGCRALKTALSPPADSSGVLSTNDLHVLPIVWLVNSSVFPPAPSIAPHGFAKLQRCFAIYVGASLVIQTGGSIVSCSRHRPQRMTIKDWNMSLHVMAISSPCASPANVIGNLKRNRSSLSIPIDFVVSKLEVARMSPRPVDCYGGAAAVAELTPTKVNVRRG